MHTDLSSIDYTALNLDVGDEELEQATSAENERLAAIRMGLMSHKKLTVQDIAEWDIAYIRDLSNLVTKQGTARSSVDWFPKVAAPAAK